MLIKLLKVLYLSPLERKKGSNHKAITVINRDRECNQERLNPWLEKADFSF